MKLLIFVVLLTWVVVRVSWMEKKINLNEFLLATRAIFFVSSFNFFTLLSYHLLNALNEINRLQFTDLTADLDRLNKGTTSVVLIGLFLYFLLISAWLSVRSIKSKQYTKISKWLNPLLAGFWFTINTGFILLMLRVFSL